MESRGEKREEILQISQKRERGRRRRVILFPLPLQGHLNPMLQLAEILRSEGGFQISIIHTRFNSPNISKYPQFSFHSISDRLSESTTTTDEQALAGDLVPLLTRLNADCSEPFRDCLAGLLSDPVSGRETIACLITDAWHFSQAVADSLDLPRIVLRTSSIASFQAYAALPLLRENGYLPKQDSRLEEPVPELPPLRVKDIPTSKARNQESRYLLIARMIKEIKASSGLIWNSFGELEQSELARLQQDFPIPTFPVGPFHKFFSASSGSLLTQDRSSISWLDSQAPRSVMYASFGSIAAMETTEFLEMAWGLANSMPPFLWVVRPGLVSGSEWLEVLPAGFMRAVGGRAHIVKWAPQQEVLAHWATGVFWTHGGWNSTLESICEGVPMICSPFFGDQLVNSRYVNDVWKVGVRLENGLERREIERAIKRVMVEAEGEEMRKRILCLRDEANLCIKQGGSSYQSLERLVDFILSF